VPTTAGFKGASRRKIIELAPGISKRILDRGLGMFVPWIMRRCMVDDDVSVWRNCEPDMNLEAGAVAMLVAWGDDLHAATRNALCMCFQPVYFAQYLGARGIR